MKEVMPFLTTYKYFNLVKTSSYKNNLSLLNVGSNLCEKAWRCFPFLLDFLGKKFNIFKQNQRRLIVSYLQSKASKQKFYECLCISGGS
jgi:hypothetical protein